MNNHKLLSEMNQAERQEARVDAIRSLRTRLIPQKTKLYLVVKHRTNTYTWLQALFIENGELVYLEYELRRLFSTNFNYDRKRDGFRFYHAGGQSPYWDFVQRLGKELYPDGFKLNHLAVDEGNTRGEDAFSTFTIL